MANLTITAASVVPGTGASIDRTKNAGAAITAGQSVYLASDNTYKLTDADGAAALRPCNGIAVSNAAVGQPVAVQTGGPITIGATVAVGTMYAASATAGGVCPIADLTTGAYPTALGFATSTTVIQLNLNYSGVAIP